MTNAPTTTETLCTFCHEPFEKTERVGLHELGVCSSPSPSSTTPELDELLTEFRLSKVRDHELQISALREQLQNLKDAKSTFSKPIPAFDEIISTYYWRLSKAAEELTRLMRTWEQRIEDRRPEN